MLKGKPVAHGLYSNTSEWSENPGFMSRHIEFKMLAVGELLMGGGLNLFAQNSRVYWSSFEWIQIWYIEGETPNLNSVLLSDFEFKRKKQSYMEVKWHSTKYREMDFGFNLRFIYKSTQFKIWRFKHRTVTFCWWRMSTGLSFSTIISTINFKSGNWKD